MVEGDGLPWRAWHRLHPQSKADASEGTPVTERSIRFTSQVTELPWMRFSMVSCGRAHAHRFPAAGERVLTGGGGGAGDQRREAGPRGPSRVGPGI